jgi:long-chain acyl-CoA synthetase
MTTERSRPAPDGHQNKRPDPNDDTHRPWVKNYPSDLDFFAEIDTTPVTDRVRNACQKHGRRSALDFLGAETSFQTVWERTEQLCGALQKELGVKKGSRVALLLPNTPYYVFAYYAVLLAGGTVVNCNPLYTVKELSHIVGNAKADIVITLDLKMLFEKAEALVEEGAIETVVVCPFASILPTVKSILFRLFKSGDVSNPARSPIASRVRHFDDLIAANHKAEPAEIDVDHDVAVQQYTGGTTGLPKGAMLSHANISANVSQIDMWCVGEYNPKAKIVSIIPFFHIFAMTTILNAGLANGMELIMLPRFDLKDTLSLLRRKKPNVLIAVPSLTHKLMTDPLSKREDLSCLTFCVSGGAALPKETREAFEKRTGSGRVVEGYGLTECSPVVTCGPVHTEFKPGSIGMPFPATDVRFADLDDPTRQVDIGERGELLVKGPQLMLGYYENEEANAQSFVDGWFRTGDVGYVDEDGHLFLVDRIKDMIIVNGFNVYPKNIEDALYQHPDVDECNVVGMSDPEKGEVPVAFVKLADGARQTEEAMKSFLAEHISRVEMPRMILFRDELPKTLIGKLSKKELREELEAKLDKD